MKKMILLMTFILGMGTWQSTKAQRINVNININLDRQPDWGPSGYDYAPYYYIPALDIYYEVNTARFYYRDGNVWIYASVLPSVYRQYNLYGLYKVVLRDRNPWAYNKLHRTAYRHYRKASPQPTIRKAEHYRYASRNMGGTSSSPKMASTAREPNRTAGSNGSNNRGFAPSQSSRPASLNQVKGNSASSRSDKGKNTPAFSGSRGEQNSTVSQNRENTSSNKRNVDSRNSRTSREAKK